jgi:hypothetical protein
MGRVYYATRILHVCPAPYYHAMKQMGTLARQVAAGITRPDQKITLGPEASEQLEHWVEKLIANEQVPIKKAMVQPMWIMFTDASPSGYGGILVNVGTGEVFQIGGKWPDFIRRKLKMDQKEKKGRAGTTELEMRALMICVERWHHLIRKDPVYVFQDNKGVIDVVRRGKSASYFVNKELLKGSKLLAELNMRLMYVASEHQMADNNSRFWGKKKTDLQEVANYVEYIRDGRWEKLLSAGQLEELKFPGLSRGAVTGSSDSPVKAYHKWMSGRYSCCRMFLSSSLN